MTPALRQHVRGLIDAAVRARILGDGLCVNCLSPRAEHKQKFCSDNCRKIHWEALQAARKRELVRA